MSHAADVTEPPGRSPETVDRLMVGVCGAIWLVWLAAASIATVALVQLGRGGGAGDDQSRSSWLLYTIIVISALVIIGAIPLLIRARRAAMAVGADIGAAESGSEPAESLQRPSDPLPTAPAAEAPTEKLRVFGAAVDPYRRKPAAPRAVSRLNVVLERIFLRGATSLFGAMGLALTAVEVATYLLAVHTDTAAWVALGLAGAIAAGMVVVFLNFHRRLAGAAVEAADNALA